MARKVVLLDDASSDLTALGLYIASQAGTAIANGYLARLHAACMSLADFPERGTKRGDILPGLRTIGFERRATIAFRVLKMLTIAYGGRDFESELSKRR